MKKFIQLTELKDDNIFIRIKKIIYFSEINYDVIENNNKIIKRGSTIHTKKHIFTVKETVKEINELISPSKI